MLLMTALTFSQEPALRLKILSIPNIHNSYQTHTYTLYIARLECLPALSGEYLSGAFLVHQWLKKFHSNIFFYILYIFLIISHIWYVVKNINYTRVYHSYMRGGHRYLIVQPLFRQDSGWGVLESFARKHAHIDSQIWRDGFDYCYDAHWRYLREYNANERYERLTNALHRQ